MAVYLPPLWQFILIIDIVAVYLDDKKIGQGRMWKSKFWLGQDMSFSKENFAPACDENHYFSLNTILTYYFIVFYL